MDKRVILLVFLYMYTVDGSPTAICRSTTTAGSEFAFEFFFDASGTSVTGLEFYDASEDPQYVTKYTGVDCSTSSATGGVFSLGFDVDVDAALPCGIDQVSFGSTTYRFAISPIGESKVYTFVCDTANMQVPIYVEENNFYTEHLTKSMEFPPNPAKVKFQVIYADGTNTPIHDDVELGRPIQLRVLYDRGTITSSKNLYGMTFHVGIFPDPGATVTIQISTPGLGSTVKITGELSGQEVDITTSVKRGTAAEITIVDAYMPTGAENDWNTENKGLKIESLDCFIGVKVTVEQGNQRMSYIPYPDRILGKTHRLVDFNNEQHFIIVATEDNTDVVLDVSNYATGGLKVDNVNIGGATNTITVPMDEYDTFYLVCDSDCADIELTSDKNIAVVVGMDTVNRYFTSQVPPTEYLNKEFLGFDDGDLYMTTYAIGTSASVTTDTVTNIGEDDVITDTDPYRLSSDEPLYTFIQDHKVNYLSASLLPGRTQMSRDNYFYFTAGFEYDVSIMSLDGDTVPIRYVTSDGVVDPFIPDTLTLTALQGNPVDLSYVRNRFTLTPTKSDTYNFFTTTDNPILVQVSELNPTTTVGSRLLSFGTLFPTVNPCVPATTLPGNGEDDDCDTFVDEERHDGDDDAQDTDTDIDDDVTLLTSLLESKIRIVTLMISDNAAFTGSNTHAIHNDGCNDQTIPAFASISPFAHNTDLNDVFDEYWVMDTPMFRAFGFRGEDCVYFRVYIEACFYDCETSCNPTTRKRRSTSEQQHFDFRIQVANSSTTTPKKDCSHNKYYWLPHVLLVLIIAIEVVTTCYMLYVKYKLKKD